MKKKEMHPKPKKVLSKKLQDKCPHKHVDHPGCLWGETCLDCGKYLNNGM